MIFHTDRGSTYTATSFTALCDRLGVRQSMGRVGSCFDNAAAEAFFSTLEHEVLSRHAFATKADARKIVLAWCHAVLQHPATAQLRGIAAARRLRENRRRPTGRSVTPPEDLSQLGTDGQPGARRQLRLPGAGCGGWEHNDLPGRFGRLRAAPLLADDVQLRSIAAAERAGESTSVQFHRGKNLAALAHPHAVSVTHVGVPDRALGIDTDPVGVVIPGVRPRPPVNEVAVRTDVVGGEPVAVGLGHDQRGAIGGDRHAVGKGEVVCDPTDTSLRRDEHDACRVRAHHRGSRSRCC